MARKLIGKFEAKAQGGLSAKVYRDSETFGFVVLFFRGGKHLVKSDYETDDRADALQTAELQVSKVEPPTITATLRRTSIEVGAPRNGRPGYRWTTGYFVRIGDGPEMHPPMRRSEAYKVAREAGATKITITD